MECFVATVIWFLRKSPLFSKNVHTSPLLGVVKLHE